MNNTAKYPMITTDVLVETNEKGGEKNISTGWHAIEFLLWSQDTTAGSPGQRPAVTTRWVRTPRAAPSTYV